MVVNLVVKKDQGDSLVVIPIDRDAVVFDPEALANSEVLVRWNCMKQHVLSVVRPVKCLLNLMERNQCIAAIVLKRVKEVTSSVQTDRVEISDHLTDRALVHRAATWLN